MNLKEKERQETWKTSRLLAKKSLLEYDFEEVREIYLNDVCSIAMMEDIPPSLIINWDQTRTHLFQFPSGQWR